ncbi:DUF2076 domain-containing protein [Geminicoccaceae bacterium 1502E]|nr:DUF2076 domain-containing protein [Geminicoccaceae bacterium 1502E]
MDQNEQKMIAELFGKLRQAEQAAGPRDAEAERLIRESVASQPAAPYYLAQVVLVQEQALQTAQARIQELESEVARRPAAGGGFLAGLFGAGAPAQGQHAQGQQARAQQPQAAQPARGPFGGAPASGPWGGRQGGGFLAGAAQTAMGVAGGMMLGSMLGSMFAGDANAAEPAADEPMPAEEDFGGGDFGDEEFF